MWGLGLSVDLMDPLWQIWRGFRLISPDILKDSINLFVSSPTLSYLETSKSEKFWETSNFSIYLMNFPLTTFFMNAINHFNLWLGRSSDTSSDFPFLWPCNYSALWIFWVDDDLLGMVGIFGHYFEICDAGSFLRSLKKFENLGELRKLRMLEKAQNPEKLKQLEASNILRNWNIPGSYIRVQEFHPSPLL